jgi:hypothetical protein
VKGGGGALICGIASLVTATTAATPSTPRRAKAQPNLPKLFINLQPLQAKLLYLLVGKKEKEGTRSVDLSSCFSILRVSTWLSFQECKEKEDTS